MWCPEVFCSPPSFGSPRLMDTSSSLDGSSFGAPSGSRKRKAPNPQRSSPRDDPTFRGVTVFMENRFIEGEWRLVIKQEYTLSPKKRRKMSSYVDSSDEDETTLSGNSFASTNDDSPKLSSVCTFSGEKHCASCSAVKTPLWRDAEDGTPLCNACGIRYKKYKLRCGVCWHIPKKDEFSPKCRSCGSYYQYVSPRR